MRFSRFVAAGALVVGSAAVLVGAAAPKAEAPPKPPAKKPAEKPAPKKVVRVVEMVLHGRIEEQAAMAMPFGPQPRLLRNYTASIRKAAKDDGVKAILLRLRQPMLGLAKIQELLDAIGEFKATEKKLFCYLDACGNGGYLLASSADRIVAAPAGMVMLTGLAAEVSFYKGLLDWAGVGAHFAARGKHKSAAEPFTRESMSEGSRQVFNEYLDDVFDQFVATIAKGRKLAPAKVRQIIDQGPYPVGEARTFGLVDDVAYYDQFLDSVGDDLGGTVKLVKDYHRLGKKGADLAQMNLFALFAALQPKPEIPATKRPKVVVIYASGVIAPKPSSYLASQVVTATETRKAFERARSDDTVKAVVLRVDSPGGSALISDLIWREVERTKKTGKPVIASMSSVAASGGYYIAMPADAIVAQPATVTGSIGVVAGKLSLGGLYKKIGITTETFTRGKNAAIFATSSGFSESERKRLDALLDDIYTTFVHKAAVGRKMPVERMRELATGRIWTARRAKELGLIDELGGLKEAYELAIKKAGLEGQDVQPVILPREKSVLEALFAPTARARPALLCPPVPEPVLHALPYAQVLELLARENVLTLMPYVIEVR